MIGQIGIMLIGVGDVFVAAKYSSSTLAAIGIAVSIINPIFLFGIGLLMGISSFVAIRLGAKKNTADSLKSSLWLALILSFVLMGLSYSLTFFIPYLKFEGDLGTKITEYIRIVILSFPFAYIYQVVKEYLQAYEKVKIPNTIAIIFAVLNVPLNFILVFGMFGFSEYGLKGLAIASIIVRALMAFSSLYFVKDKLMNSNLDKEQAHEILKFSFPIAGMFFLEVLGFCLCGVLAGKFGIIQAGTNNLVLNISSLSFMIPLSISSAVSVKVGNAYGQKSFDKIKWYSCSAMSLTLTFMIFTALTFIFIPQKVLGLATDNKEILILGSTVLLIVAFFQIVDGIQVTIGGILRGLGRTKETFIAVLMGYWIIGIPTGIYLGFYKELKLIGLWTGLALALTCVSIALLFVSLKYFKHFDKEGI
jgi:MATE family multidrug resistance protein